MKTLAIVATKGGVGKSTLVAHLAVQASQRWTVGIADCDVQGSVTRWFNLREAETPVLRYMSPGDLLGFKQGIQADTDLLIIDTAPSHGDDIRIVAEIADFVLIPCRPQLFDLDGIRSAVEIVVETNTPAAIVLNACPPGRVGKEASQTLEARAALKTAPIPVCPVSITQRATFAHALTTGAAANEFEPNGKAAAEIAALWKWTGRKL